MHTITMSKHGATWSYFTLNEVGGGFGSNYCGPQYIALMRARENIKPGQQYKLIINGEDRGLQTRP
jgi:hypothetical protein